MFDIRAIRDAFPILRETVYGYPLVYLDNAATTQKPQVVLDRILSYYTRENSGVHRGMHSLSQQAGEMYESVRESTAAFINASAPQEIVFTSGATESVNLAAFSFGRAFVDAGDEIIVTEMEHHSNLVPWQQLCERRGASLNVLPVDDSGTLQVDRLDALISERTRIFAVTAVSNVLGTVNPIDDIIGCAHARGVPVLIDAAQAVPHMPLDVQALDCDFLVFSGHKMYAGTGVGVLYGKQQWLDAMPPYQTGGGMVDTVGIDSATYAALPHTFEAGSGNAAGVAGLGAAIDYLSGIGLEAVAAYERELTGYAVECIGSLADVHLYGVGATRCGSVSFNLTGAHHADVGMILDKLGIAVRTGKHCAEPLMNRLGIDGTVRASFALYNTREEVDALAAGIEKARKLLLS